MRQMCGEFEALGLSRTFRAVWELTAYTNGHVFLTGCFSGELHLPIRQLGVSYGLISLAELPPPILKTYVTSVAS